jgi:hypothetical protein
VKVKVAFLAFVVKSARGEIHHENASKKGANDESRSRSSSYVLSPAMARCYHLEGQPNATITESKYRLVIRVGSKVTTVLHTTSGEFIEPRMASNPTTDEISSFTADDDKLILDGVVFLEPARHAHKRPLPCRWHVATRNAAKIRPKRFIASRRLGHSGIADPPNVVNEFATGHSSFGGGFSVAQRRPCVFH